MARVPKVSHHEKRQEKMHIEPRVSFDARECRQVGEGGMGFLD